MMAIGCSAVVLFLFNPARHSFYPFCLFHQTTGLLCPGCGSLRALHQLLHGHIAAALHFNALLVLSIPVIGWVAVRYTVRRLKGEPQSFDFHPAWLWGLLLLGLLFGVLR